MTDFEAPHRPFYFLRRGEWGGVGSYKEKTISAQIKSRENVHKKKSVIEIHVGEAFQLAKSAAKLQIQVAQRVFLGVFAKDVNRPIIWDCSHGRGFAPVRTEIMF